MNNLILNENDPPYLMMHKIEVAMIALKKEKYQIILNFINELFSKKYTLLKNVKNIQDNNFDNTDHIKNIILKYNPIFQKKYKINTDLYLKKDINLQIIILLLKKLTKSIDYFVSKKNINNKINYSIENNK